MVWSLRRNIDWHGLSNFLLGGAFGLPVGIWLLMHTNPKLYMHLIGALLVLYAGFMIFRRPVVLRRQRELWDVLAGFAGGVTGGLAAFPARRSRSGAAQGLEQGTPARPLPAGAS